MSMPVLTYRYAERPSRGLAATGVFFIKFVLAIPVLVMVSALSSLAGASAYIGFFFVAFTGRLPGGLYHFMEQNLRWSTRAYGWIIGFTDTYPPFEIDPAYAVDIRVEPPVAPSKGWAWTGIFLIKFVLLIPHIVVLSLVIVALTLAVWFGYFVVLFTGSMPTGIQDLAAGAIQWGARINAFAFGITDDYPPFSLQVTASA